MLRSSIWKRLVVGTKSSQQLKLAYTRWQSIRLDQVMIVLITLGAISRMPHGCHYSIPFLLTRRRAGLEVHPTVQHLILSSSDWPDQKSEAWWESRKWMLTASDVAAVIGDSPYSNAAKVSGLKLGTILPQGSNAATRHGDSTEAEALKAYQARFGEKCISFGLKPHER